MDSLPDSSIPILLSHMSMEDVCRCACIAKDWASCAKQRRNQIREDAARKRAQSDLKHFCVRQMTEEQKKNIDLDLYMAADSGSTRDVQELLSRGADVDSRQTMFSETALLRVAQVGYSSVVKGLLEWGASIDARSNSGATALIKASRYGYLETVKILVANGAMIDTRDDYQNTALMFACIFGRLEVTKTLVAQGANTDTQSLLGYTPLIFAVRFNRLAVVEALIALGAQIDMKDNNGNTALDHAVKKGFADIDRVLRAAGDSQA